jgi:hypothetical protein
MTHSFWPQQSFTVSAWLGVHPTFLATVLDRPSGQFSEGAPSVKREETHHIAGLVLVIRSSRV